MSKINTFIQKHRGEVFNTKDLAQLLGSREMITRACERGVEKIARGFYGINAPLGKESFLIASKYYSAAVICGSSALFLQGLSDYDPHVIHLAFHRESALLVDTELFNFHRLSTKKLSIGIEIKSIQGINLKIFTPERCLYEVAKYGPNSEDFVKCMRFYFNQYQLTRVDKILNLGNSFPGKELILSALNTLKSDRGIY